MGRARKPSITHRLAAHVERMSFAVDAMYSEASKLHPHPADGNACPQPLEPICRGHQALTASKVRIQSEAAVDVFEYRAGGRHV